MLPEPTAFPQVGSYALLPQPGADPHLARIQFKLSVGDDPTVKVSLPLVPGSSGNRTVTLGELEDATPLSDAEIRELDALSSRGLAGTLTARAPRRNLTRKKRARYDLLTAREGRARTLARLLERLAHHQRAMARAA